MRQHEEKFENLPEDFQLTKAYDDACFIRNVCQAQFFMTIFDVHLSGYGSTSSCRENLRNNRSQPKRFIRGNTKIGPVLEFMATENVGRCGMEVKIDSMKKHGTQSWMVISKGVDKNVTELSEENKKLIHFEEASSSTGKLVAMEQREPFIPSSSSSSTLPIKQRKWKDIEHTYHVGSSHA